MIEPKNRSEAERSVQSIFFETENLSISAGENIVAILRGCVICMRAIVGMIRSRISLLSGESALMNIDFTIET
jgi:hypothetical protein